MKYFIITGTSRGIGEAIARELLMKGHTLICASRTMNENLVETAAGMDVPLFYHECDISKPGVATTFMRNAFRVIDTHTAESIVLVNNAGVLEPIGPSGSLRVRQMEQHLRTNLLTPAILINSFIRYTARTDAAKTILNISSGAAEYPYHGWSMYCSSKAGIDMLTRTIAVEQETARFPVKIFSLKPGIVETSMQSLIRQTGIKKFRERQKFISLHEEGKLASPKSVAELIARTLISGKIPQGATLSIAQLKNLPGESDHEQ